MGGENSFQSSFEEKETAKKIETFVSAKIRKMKKYVDFPFRHKHVWEKFRKGISLRCIFCDAYKLIGFKE